MGRGGRPTPGRAHAAHRGARSATVVWALCSALLAGVAVLGLDVDRSTEQQSYASPLDPPGSTGPERRERPNVVLVMTDDMRDTDLLHMPRTRRLLQQRGTTFTSYLSPNPICCPDRTSVLTGQHAHNHGVHYNVGPWGGWSTFRDPEQHLGVWLQRVGYTTGLIGKFLNGYGGWDAPRVTGWDHWDPYLRGLYKPYGMVVFGDGNRHRVRPGLHTTDYVTTRTAAFIRRSAGDRPFFVWASYVAPHAMTRPGGRWGPPVPAERHEGVLEGVPAPVLRKPSFDVRSPSGEALLLRPRPQDRDEIQRSYTARLQSLQGVDEGVARLHRALRDAGELDETIIAFVSDNGLLLGEHGLTDLAGKGVPYEEALQVPALLSGPGVPAGRRFRGQVSTVDLAATIIHVAGAAPDRIIDGRSLLSILRTGRGTRYQLIQGGAPHREWLFRGVRTTRWKFVRYADGSEVLHDLREDPHELRNLRRAHPDVAARLSVVLDRLEVCAGRSCHLTGVEPRAPRAPRDGPA